MAFGDRLARAVARLSPDCRPAEGDRIQQPQTAAAVQQSPEIKVVALVAPFSELRVDVAAWGDLRPCLVCRNLSPTGRCLAAWRGEIDGSRDYFPSIRNQPKRCYGYAPTDADPEQTPGRERWPYLAPDPTHKARRFVDVLPMARVGVVDRDDSSEVPF